MDMDKFNDQIRRLFGDSVKPFKGKWTEEIIIPIKKDLF